MFIIKWCWNQKILPPNCVYACFKSHNELTSCSHGIGSWYCKWNLNFKKKWIVHYTSHLLNTSWSHKYIYQSLNKLDLRNKFQVIRSDGRTAQKLRIPPPHFHKWCLLVDLYNFLYGWNGNTVACMQTLEIDVIVPSILDGDDQCKVAMGDSRIITWHIIRISRNIHEWLFFYSFDVYNNYSSRTESNIYKW